MMTPSHVWSGNGCIGLHDLPRRIRLLDLPNTLRLNPYYKNQAEKLYKFQDPVIHTSQSRFDNRQLLKVNQTILLNEPSIHIIAVTERDSRHSDEYWLTDSLEHILTSARLCRNTVVVIVDLIRINKSARNIKTRRRIRQVVTRFGDVAKRIDAAVQLRSNELDEFGLTDAGSKLVVEMIIQHLHDSSKHF